MSIKTFFRGMVAFVMAGILTAGLFACSKKNNEMPEEDNMPKAKLESLSIDDASYDLNLILPYIPIK